MLIPISFFLKKNLIIKSPPTLHIQDTPVGMGRIHINFFLSMYSQVTGISIFASKICAILDTF